MTCDYSYTTSTEHVMYALVVSGQSETHPLLFHSTPGGPMVVLLGISQGSVSIPNTNPASIDQDDSMINTIHHPVSQED